MASETQGSNRHFVLGGVTETEPYRPPRIRPEPTVIPERDRVQHGGALLRQIDELKPHADQAQSAQQDSGIAQGWGIQVEFESFPDIELAFESLARERSGIELDNVRHEDNRTHATVFVPDGKLDHFERLIRDYLTERQDSLGRSLDHRRLLNTIRQIRAASLRALWTDDPVLFPQSQEETFWWEVWLPVRQDRDVTAETFRRQARTHQMEVAKGDLIFPERTVLLVYASLEQMQRSIITLNSIAELRRAKETADFFDSMPLDEQRAWLEDLRSRSRYVREGEATPHVCLLDTGVNRGHPLLGPALATDDLHTVDPAWGTADGHGHGTEMAGLSLFGNLVDPIASNDPVLINHRLESVKLLPHGEADGTDPIHHGHRTVEAVARPEITAPRRRRVFGMAVTARDNRDRGRPSAWSAAIDSLAADVGGGGDHPRLLVVSAGNVLGNSAWADYPHSNDTDGLHDPAQAWNALTVGAYTDLVQITEVDASSSEPLAPEGGLSPFSTTSLTWQQRLWPLKPDIVLEGGNVATDALGAVSIPSLSLLTASHRPADSLFTTSRATSAATALASRMAAQVMAVYPDLTPEAVRALIVHSAEWTNAMKSTYLPRTGGTHKRDYERLIQRCGFGVPDLDRALWSVANSLTMVVQERLHPFKRETGKEPVLRDMHLHNLPWPSEILESLGETQVEMRVTLSYFVEPNPSRRGVRSRYRYASHGLRFDVKRPFESVDEFRRRINVAARDEEHGTRITGNDPSWLIGPQIRHRGSLHGDIWRGTASDLASRGSIAVYPAVGWWKTRPALERYDQAARYALVVSIRAPEIDVDLYTEVANQIATQIAVTT